VKPPQPCLVVEVTFEMPIETSQRRTCDARGRADPVRSPDDTRPRCPVSPACRRPMRWIGRRAPPLP